ncbi:MAG: Sir2 family NAD-dependent protein deacetylase [Acidimicrobiales bacterium]|nr:Sir2 family NAD-dependent protein deacetylase [Acidimicrobiales bacterium]
MDQAPTTRRLRNRDRASTRPAWRVPIRHPGLKRPALDELHNVFSTETRLISFGSRLEAASAAPDPHSCSVGGVHALVITPASVTDLDERGWIPLEAREVCWSGDSDIRMRHRRVPTQAGDDLELVHVFSGTVDVDLVERRAIEGLAGAPPAGADVRPVAGQLLTPVRPQVSTLDGAAAALTGRPLVVCTGAGFSRAAGIQPMMGTDGLDGRLGLSDRAQLRLERLLVEDPATALDQLAQWHLSFLEATPSPAHHALADLEARGHLAQLLTTNFDRLHEIAGNRRIVTGSRLHRAAPPRDAGVLVLGAANEMHGAIERARGAGATVVCVDYEAPHWLEDDDHWIRGDVEAATIELASRVRGVRSPLAPARHAPSAPALDRTVTAAGRQPLGPPWSTIAALAERVRDGATHRRSRVHGPRHWLTVAWIGARLAHDIPEIDPVVVTLFAMMHDCQRLHDGTDPDHGIRAARMAEALLADEGLLSESQLGSLVSACAGHSDGYTTGDPTVGACWDADRLDLWRIGASPHPSMLSHESSAGVMAWSRSFTDLGRGDVAWDDWRPLAHVLAHRFGAEPVAASD